MSKMIMGKIEQDEPPGRRDAFHVPAVLVTSHDNLSAGDSVKFTNGFFTVVEKSSPTDRHAIIDPFVGKFKPGDAVWAMLIPGATVDLTHTFRISVKGIIDMYSDPDGFTNDCRAMGCD